MILVDSRRWIEYLAHRPLARRFAPYLEGREPLVASAIQIYEVYKAMRRDFSEDRAVTAVAALRHSMIVPVDESLALDAADLALLHRLAMADALVYATARRHSARLITTDTDFAVSPTLWWFASGYPAARSRSDRPAPAPRMR
ncbi:MAG: type II toxin-antitoxin system VapC family toxin [Candidatus Rokubacteria bacterium]|nr:type II toxin-antitoxin system VapC family toxin [Candidatus Rokubacteria bacterium]